LALVVTLLVSVLVLIPAGPASATTAVLDATDSGMWRATGFHNPAVNNYCVGVDCGPETLRNYFTFSVPPSATITSATLSLVNPQGGSGTMRPYTLYDVSTSAAALDADTAGGPAGVAVYDDLGTGTVLGSVTPANFATSPVDVPLNAAGVTALNTARGETISLGGSLVGAVGSEFLFAATTGDVGQVTLTLTLAAPTQLTVKTPAKVAWGAKAKVRGILSSTVGACTDGVTLEVTAGGKKMTATTLVGGSYSFKVKITKKTKVKVVSPGNLHCAAVQKERTIKVQ
jgi:hypothetical protein